MARKKGRNVDGVLLVDKPQGLSSNQALRRVSTAINARKAGHTGSLDPLATGLLVLCFGEATKVSGWLLDADKTYHTTAVLGVTTDSADADGSVVERCAVQGLDRATIERVLAQFRGPQQQVPPMFSALKHQGKRLYELARAGVEVERTPRAVTIYDLELRSWADNQIDLSVRCSKGTYIRSLVADIGEALGCGAHVGALRRVALQPFEQPAMWTLEQVEVHVANDPAALDGQLLSADCALVDLDWMALSEVQARAFGHGQAVVTDSNRCEQAVRVYDQAQQFLGIGWHEPGGWIQPRRLLVQRGAQG